MSRPSPGRGTPETGGLAVILASICCLGPLFLLTLGFGSAWIDNLSALEWYWPLLAGGALAALLLAWRRWSGRRSPSPGSIDRRQ